jgi:flagellar motor protein MotB
VTKYGVRQLFDEGQNYLATVSDLMAGLIFLFLITLMIFVLRYQSATASIQSSDKTRSYLLETLQDSLQKRGLSVEVDDRNGVLRLTEQSINFPSGSVEPLEAHEPRVAVLAEVLAGVLPCFLSGSSCEEIMPAELTATVSVVMIEGHTDTLSLSTRHRLESNLELSGARAATVHRLLTATAPSLGEMRNREGQKILSISGYGSERLVDQADPLSELNRRIDLRFIMDPPRPVEARLPEPARQIEDSLRVVPH